MRFRFTFIAASTLLALACGSSSPTGPSGTSGNFSMMIKDAPFADAKAVFVTFSDVSVHKSGESESSWTKVAFSGGATTRTCDLKKLQSATDILGVGTLTAGHYTQVRLTVSDAKLYFDNANSGSACAASLSAPAGASASLTIPSGEVKLNREFDVKDSGSTTMTIDFDGDKSIHQTGSGNYMMSPVIAVVSVQ